MIIAGQISSKEEAQVISNMAKLFVVGKRARFLGRKSIK